MNVNKTSEIHSLLALALEILGKSSTDPFVVNAASHYLLKLSVISPSDGEQVVRDIRNALSSPKTDFTDSLDDNKAFLSARHDAYVAAKNAVNHYVGLRRPDLTVVVSSYIVESDRSETIRVQ